MKNFFKEGIVKNIIPLMLCVSIVTSCMYIYAKEYLALFALIAFIIQATVFSFYTFLSKKSMILRFVSILGSFAAICAMVSIAVKTGNNKSDIDFFIWFLSPQSLVEFSIWYIIATYIVINFFIASTVYYFSAVRYRISMTFLITLIPFAFYRKEGDKVPVFFALLLLVMYIALMIHCRQLNTKSNHKVIMDTGYKKSMFYFLAVSTILTLIIPKPEIYISNEWVDSVFESQKITDYMLSRLGIVSETATSSVTYTHTADVKLYEFKADELPINLKSQTYSIYDFNKNTWRTSESELEGSKYSFSMAKCLNPAGLYAGIMKAAELDKDFSEEYELGSMKPELEHEYISSYTLLDSKVQAKYFYVPVNAFRISGTGAYNKDIYRSNQGMIFSGTNSGNNYSVDYYSDLSINDEDFKKIVKKMDMEKFGKLLERAEQILKENDEYECLVSITSYLSDYYDSVQYLDMYEIKDVPDSVYNLAEKITQRYDSDYEKALAIQDYFKLNDYVYDLSYQKPADYNMEYFLKTGKTGICSDFATAMTVLARVIGIPARYAEGIHLHDADENGIVTVRDSDLHAFPELYIAGYGWMSFEPTQLGVQESKSDFDYLVSVMLALSAVTLIVLVVLWNKIFGPALSEYIFSLRIKKSSDEKAVELVMNRIRKILKISSGKTSGEVSDFVKEFYGIDINDMAAEYDSIVYGGLKNGRMSGDRAFEIYLKLKEISKKTPVYSSEDAI